MRDLQDVYKKALEVMEDCGIKTGNVSELTTTNRKLWGNCRYNYDGTYTIKISEKLLEESVDENAVMSTMLHELIHTIPMCMNHKKPFQVRAKAIMEKYPQFIIKTKNSFKEFGFTRDVRREEAKYIIKCENCDNEIYRDKMSKPVQHPEFYKCGCCGGKLRRVK